ncbi:MAG: signal peptidase II [Mycoplasma sp.]|nr:signal peptidase II [Mycoplasma sp.]
MKESTKKHIQTFKKNAKVVLKNFFSITRKQFIINLAIISLTFIIFVTIDQTTKSWAFSNYKGGLQYQNGFVGVRLAKNTGMFRSLGNGIGFAGVQTLTSLISIIMFVFALFSKNLIRTFAVALLFAGSMGNIIDRYSQPGHYVRDWIFTPWTKATSNGGTYNIADVEVMVGSGIMLIYIIYLLIFDKEEN